MQTQSVWFYVTCPDESMARSLATGALKKHLIACANIIPMSSSLYWWEGEIQEATEVLLVGKTTEDQFAAAKDFFVSKHPYECPCVIALPITQGHTPFLQWIEGQCRTST